MNAASLSMRPSPELLRLLAAGAIALGLQAPIARIAGLVSERQTRLDAAVAEVTDKSGQTQRLEGPMLVVPFTRTLETSGSREGQFEVTLLPETLEITGTLDSEIRQRGIYGIPVYQVDLKVQGRFTDDDLAGTDADLETLDWSRARLVMGISGIGSLQSLTRLQWEDQEYGFLPGVGRDQHATAGIHAPLNLKGIERGAEFSFPITLSGSQGLYFTPHGKETTIDLQGESGLASFQGNWLPVAREVTDEGFLAKWTVPYLARNYPQAWTSQTVQGNPNIAPAVAEAAFGLELLAPVNAYRMTDRSVKYAGLFLILTFALVWLMEVLAGLRVHPIQYLMVGAAMCIFYLLELSLAEHLPFRQGYLLASGAIVGLCTAYGASVLHRWRRALLLGGVLSGLYGYLYVVLTNEDRALLVGSLGLLAALALIMYATRGVDWYATRRKPGLTRPRDPEGEAPAS